MAAGVRFLMGTVCFTAPGVSMDSNRHNGLMVSAITSPTRPNRPWLILAAVVAVVVGGGHTLVDRAQLTSTEAYEALASGPFEQPLPAAVKLAQLRSVRRRGDPERPSTVSFADLEKTRQGEGAVALISYQIYPSAEAAQDAYENLRSSLLETPGFADRRIWIPEQSDYPSFCVAPSYPSRWCHGVYGAVEFEAESRISMFHPGQPDDIRLLFESAVDHLKATTAGS